MFKKDQHSMNSVLPTLSHLTSANTVPSQSSDRCIFLLIFHSCSVHTLWTLQHAPDKCSAVLKVFPLTVKSPLPSLQSGHLWLDYSAPITLDNLLSFKHARQVFNSFSKAFPADPHSWFPDSFKFLFKCSIQRLMCMTISHVHDTLAYNFFF